MVFRGHAYSKGLRTVKTSAVGTIIAALAPKNSTGLGIQLEKRSLWGAWTPALKVDWVCRAAPACAEATCRTLALSVFDRRLSDQASAGRRYGMSRETEFADCKSHTEQ